MLTKNETVLIKKSWDLLRKIDPIVLGDVFYSKLFLTILSYEKCFLKIWRVSAENFWIC
jgi:hypothetical protein